MEMEMAKFGLIGTLIAVEIAFGLSAVTAAGCEDQLGYNSVDEISVENARFVLGRSAQPSAFSSVLWESTPMEAPPHEQINELGGS